jgi:hypothetical protein
LLDKLPSPSVGHDWTRRVFSRSYDNPRTLRIAATKLELMIRSASSLCRSTSARARDRSVLRPANPPMTPPSNALRTAAKTANTPSDMPASYSGNRLGATSGPHATEEQRTLTVTHGEHPAWSAPPEGLHPQAIGPPGSLSHGRGHGLHLVLARKTVSAAHRCNRTMTCRSALDTAAACGRQPLLYSAPSLLESSWWPAVPRIRLLPRRQVQPGRLPRARRRARPAPVGPSLASSR